MPDNDPSAGATPAAGGATPPQSPPAQPAAGSAPTPPTPPATGDQDGLGDAGKRAIDAMKAERKAALDRATAAEKDLEALKASTLSESEKAIAEAKKAGASEVQQRFEAQIRRSEVRAALAAKGIRPDVLDLAVKADEFASLKVSDDGIVENLDTAVDAFAKARAELFKPAAAAGTADGGNSGSGKTITRDQVKKMTPEEITAALDRGDLAGLLKPAG